jgi:hypothetical protein
MVVSATSAAQALPIREDDRLNRVGSEPDGIREGVFEPLVA